MTAPAEHAALVDALTRIARTVERAHEWAASEYGISAVLARMLRVLGSRAPTISELAADLALDKSSTSGLVERAQQRGLVRRVPSQRDRRSVRVRLTDAGRARSDQIWALHGEALDALLEPLSDADRTALANTIALLLGD